ncbi:MAG: DUF87 domain-containing protein [Candidatus Aenigmatarchaeota archaeon]
MTGLYVNTTLSYADGNVSFDYTEYDDEGINANNLGIYYCINYTNMVGCNNNWTRINGSVLNTTTRTIETNVSNFSVAHALAEYVCANGVCEETYGETEANCPQDCKQPETPPVPQVPVTDTGGTGAGAGSGAAAGAAVEVKETLEGGEGGEGAAVPIEIRSTLLFVILAPGEREIHSLEIVNNEDVARTATLSLEGNVVEFIKFDKTLIDVESKTTEVIKVDVFALGSAIPGIYIGDIVTTIEGKRYVTPITVKIEIPEEPLLDVFLETLTKVIGPGQELLVRLTLKNMGETATIEDIIVNYMIRNLATGEVLKEERETVAVKDTLSYTRGLLIPNDTVYDRYILEVNVSYYDDSKSASAADAFDVSSLPLPLLILQGLLLNPLAYLVIFMVPVAYGGLRVYKKRRLSRVKKARYIFPVDMKKLPQPGPNALLVGKIAETDKPAYEDMHSLMTHSIAAGGTGSGKSVSAMVVVEELLKRNLPVIVFDPTAQWTGFIEACKDPHMLSLYPKFNLKPTDARSFKTNIIIIDDPDTIIDIRDHMKPGEITACIMTSLTPPQIDRFVRRTVETIFAGQWPESPELKVLVIYDEVHRLLPKYGGKGGYVALERGAREFRKWGIGLFLISQVLSDFKGAIRANISTEVQLRTKYGGDINRVKTKYGADYASKLVKLTTGTGIVQNPEYNDGKPWFIAFRPLLHNTRRLTEEEIQAYVKVENSIIDIDKKIETLKGRGIDTYDVELELNMAKDKMKQGLFKMAETYVDSVSERIKKLGG